MGRSHQGLVSWIFNVNIRMMVGLELNLEITGSLSAALLSRHIYSECVQVNTAFVYWETFSKQHVGVQHSRSMAIMPNCPIHVRCIWGEECPHQGHLTASGHVTLTSWSFTATTEVRLGLLVHMVLLKRMAAMHESFKSNKLFPLSFRAEAIHWSLTACIGLHRKLHVWGIIFLCQSESNIINTGKKGKCR